MTVMQQGPRPLQALSKGYQEVNTGTNGGLGH